jgi:hypothetical protein
MTPGQHVPLISWATHVIQSSLQRVATGKPEANRKKGGASSDKGLQLDLLKPELLVIAGQHTAVNTFSSLVLGSPCDRVRKLVQIQPRQFTVS